MNSYLSRLTDSADFDRLNALKPAALCPYLYYTIAPYIYTIAAGGWFSWVRRSRRPTDRKPAAIKNPALKKTNRLFVNEVLVRCPNAGGNIIAGIGPWENDGVAVRILYNGGDCACRLTPGRQFIVENDGGHRAVDYSRLFPEALLQAMAAMPLNDAMNLYDQDRAGTMMPAEIINPCRYHRGKAVFDSRRLLPDGCCPHFFQHIYPDVLAAMFDADIDPVRVITYPGSGAQLTAAIEKIPHVKGGRVDLLKDGCYDLFGRLFHPLERLDYDIKIRIVAAEVSTACRPRAGDVYSVNLRRPDFLCPASFHAVYPYLLLAAAGTKMNWDDSPADNLIPCPDCAGVVYAITGPRNA